VTELIYTTAVAASIPSLGLDLDVEECEITLDETRAPYVEAKIRIPIPVEAVMETIDTRDDLRVSITAEVEWVSPADPTQTRTFDLVLHERVIDHGGRVVLVCHSDEALAIDGGLCADEIDQRYRRAVEFDSSDPTLRNLIDGVLGSAFGATLEAGTADADLTVTRDRINLLPNGGCENASPAWGLTAGTGASAFTRSTAVTPYAGTYSTRWTAAAGAAGVRATPDNAGGYFAVTPGKRYQFGIQIRSSVSRVYHVWLRFYSGTGSGILLDVTFDPVLPTSTTDWRSATVEAVAPAGATTMSAHITTDANSAGQFHYLDGMFLNEMADDEIAEESGWVGYFDGSYNPDSAHYTVAWTGTAHQSTSTLTRLDDRDQAGLDIEPGDLWWDFLSPHVRANDFRLWSDENRDWWLTETGDTVAGTVTIAEGENAIGGQDRISYQATDDGGAPLFFTAVVVRYRWMLDGVQQTRYDFAGIGTGEGRKVHRVDIDRPWPGAGRAAAILAAAQARGRTQELDAVMNLDATPGMALSTDMPSTPEQIGVVSAVTWRWSDGPDHGTMSVRARDLVEAP
jgi:hypothetical protein